VPYETYEEDEHDPHNSSTLDINRKHHDDVYMDEDGEMIEDLSWDPYLDAEDE
jgi:hypothetical protein